MVSKARRWSLSVSLIFDAKDISFILLFFSLSSALNLEIRFEYHQMTRGPSKYGEIQETTDFDAFPFPH